VLAEPVEAAQAGLGRGLASRANSQAILCAAVSRPIATTGVVVARCYARGKALSVPWRAAEIVFIDLVILIVLVWIIWKMVMYKGRRSVRLARPRVLLFEAS
jgi:hypothetical protein